MINIYQDAPLFVDGVEFSGSDGNVLRNNAIFLDGLVQQPISVFAQGIYQEARDFMGRNVVTLVMPRAWWGAFQYKQGYTDAVYIVDGILTANEHIRIYHKKIEDVVTDENTPGTLVYDALWPTTKTTITVAIDGAGYTDGQIVEVVIQVYFPGPTYTKTGLYRIYNATTYPIDGNVSLAAWPGLPTFGSGVTVTETNLNMLSNAQDWLMNRLALVPRVPFINGMFVNGTHKSLPATMLNNPHILHIGYINKGNGQDTFHGEIDYYIFNGQETIQVYIDGALKYTSPTYVNGQVGTLDFTFDISYLTDGIDYSVGILSSVPIGQGGRELNLYGNSIINSRYTIKILEATGSRAYYAPSSAFDVLESMTYATLKSRLNNFVTGTQNAYDAITNNPAQFNYARMFRKKVGVDDHQNTVLDNESLPLMRTRIGERFIVAGKDVKIAWGGYTLTKDMKVDYTANDIYEFANTESLTGSDKVEVKEGYFQEFEGLFVGSTYFILGRDVAFFSEYLR